MKSYNKLLESLLYPAFCNSSGNPDNFRIFDSDDINESIIVEGYHEQQENFTDPDVTGTYSQQGHSLRDKGYEHKFGEPFDDPTFFRNLLSSTYNESLAKNHLNKFGDNDASSKLTFRYTRDSSKLNKTLFDLGKSGKEVPDTIDLSPPLHSIFGGDKDIFDVKTFDNIINTNPLPHGVTVYTGYHGNPFIHKQSILHAYTSTSLSPDVSKEFGQEFSGSPKVKHILRINLPKGFPHLHTPLNSHYPAEDEVLLPRGLMLHLPNTQSHTILLRKHDSSLDREIHLWDAKLSR